MNSILDINKNQLFCENLENFENFPTLYETSQKPISTLFGGILKRLKENSLGAIPLTCGPNITYFNHSTESYLGANYTNSVWGLLH